MESTYYSKRPGISHWKVRSICFYWKYLEMVHTTGDKSKVAMEKQTSEMVGGLIPRSARLIRSPSGSKTPVLV